MAKQPAPKEKKTAKGDKFGGKKAPPFGSKEAASKEKK
jgi:hypothetical protein